MNSGPKVDQARAKLAESRQRTQVLQVAQMRPNQSPEKLALLRDLERSQRAETKLRLKAVAHEESEARAAARTKGQTPR